MKRKFRQLKRWGLAVGLVGYYFAELLGEVLMLNPWLKAAVLMVFVTIGTLGLDAYADLKLTEMEKKEGEI